METLSTIPSAEARIKTFLSRSPEKGEMTTRQVSITVAMELSREVTKTARPLRTFLSLSVSDTDKEMVSPTNAVSVTGEIRIEAAGIGRTLSWATPVTLPTVATTEAVLVKPPKYCRVVALPVGESCTMLVSELVQVTARPTRASPVESRTVALNWTLAPTTVESLDGEIIT
jgi:hypothetical protein